MTSVLSRLSSVGFQWEKAKKADKASADKEVDMAAMGHILVRRTLPRARAGQRRVGRIGLRQCPLQRFGHGRTGQARG